MSEEPEVAVFKASFPPIKSAILLSGDGNGGSIKLDIPELEIAVFKQLVDMRREELIVTVQRAAQPQAATARVVGWRERKRTA